MALISCPSCGNSISDKAVVCPKCGKNVLNMEVPDTNEEAKERKRCIECGVELADDELVCPNCGCPVESVYLESETNSEQTSTDNAKKKSKLTPILIIIGIVAVMVAIGGTLYLILSSDGMALSKAKKHIKAGQYLEAINDLSKIEDSGKTEDVYKDIYAKMEEEISEFIVAGDLSAAQKKLNDYNMLPNKNQIQDSITHKKMLAMYDSQDYIKLVESFEELNDKEIAADLLEKTYEKMEDEIEVLMDEGDYIKAQKKLNEYNMLPQFKKIQNSIIDESLTLKSAFEIKPLMKNPNSLQINSIKFYQSTKVGDPYPIIVINESGQNGFGGYSTGWALFSASDLSLVGTCRSMDEDTYNLNKEDDIVEWLVCKLIKGYTNPLDIEVNLGRVNRLLSSNNTLKYDVEQYVGLSGGSSKIS